MKEWSKITDLKKGEILFSPFDSVTLYEVISDYTSGNAFFDDLRDGHLQIYVPKEVPDKNTVTDSQLEFIKTLQEIYKADVKITLEELGGEKSGTAKEVETKSKEYTDEKVGELDKKITDSQSEILKTISEIPIEDVKKEIETKQEKISEDVLDALNSANSPNKENPFATISELKKIGELEKEIKGKQDSLDFVPLKEEDLTKATKSILSELEKKQNTLSFVPVKESDLSSLRKSIETNLESKQDKFGFAVAKASDLSSLEMDLKRGFLLKQDLLKFTPENIANKENEVIDDSVIKYPTVNLLKTGLDETRIYIDKKIKDTKKLIPIWGAGGSGTDVLGTKLTGYVVGANIALVSTDTVLGAFKKIQGQINAIGGGGFITSKLDTDSIALTVVAGALSADLQIQNTVTINLSVDGSGLKADFATLNISQFTNDSGYLTVETDPVFSAWLATPPNISVFNNDSGYLTSVTAHNILSATHADTVAASVVLGDLIYGNATPKWERLAGNITTTRKFLRQVGDGVISAAPDWDTVTKTDVGLSNVENTALSSWAGSTNITTLGTIVTGTWTADVIGDTYISSAATWNSKQAGHVNLTSLSGLTYVSTSFVKMTAAGTFALDTNTYIVTGGAELPLTFSTGLTRSVNTITSNLSTGIAGSQSVIGGTAASETLTLSSTAHATKGKILLGTSDYDEVNNSLGIGISTPIPALHISGNRNVAGTAHGFAIDAATFTNTLSAGTVASGGLVNFATPILDSSVAVTYTDAYTLRIGGAPTATGNVTITDKWAIWIDSGDIRADGKILIRDGSVLQSALTSQFTIEQASVTVDGMEIVSKRAAIVSGDIIGGINFKSDDTQLTAPGVSVAQIRAIATTTHTATNLNTDLVFRTTFNTTTFETFRISAASPTAAYFYLAAASISANTYTIYGDGSSTVFNAPSSSGLIKLNYANVNKFQFDSTAIVKIGGQANRATTVGTNYISIFDGTAPVGTLANGVSLFSASGKLKSIDAAGLTGWVLASSAVTTEAVVSDTTLTVQHNGVSYKILAKA